MRKHRSSISAVLAAVALAVSACSADRVSSSSLTPDPKRPLPPAALPAPTKSSVLGGDAALASLVSYVSEMDALGRSDLISPNARKVALHATTRVTSGGIAPLSLEEGGFIDYEGITYWSQDGVTYAPEGTKALIFYPYFTGTLGVSPIEGVGGTIKAGFMFKGDDGRQSMSFDVKTIKGDKIVDGENFDSFGARAGHHWWWPIWAFAGEHRYGRVTPQCGIKLTGKVTQEAWYSRFWKPSGISTGNPPGVSLSIRNDGNTSIGLQLTQQTLLCTSVHAVKVNLGSTTIAMSSTTTATATAFTEDEQDITSSCEGFTWSSSAPAVASVGSDGAVRGLAAGSAQISAACNSASGIVGSATIEVQCGTLAKVAHTIGASPAEQACGGDPATGTSGTASGTPGGTGSTGTTSTTAGDGVTYWQLDCYPQYQWTYVVYSGGSDAWRFDRIDDLCVWNQYVMSLGAPLPIEDRPTRDERGRTRRGGGLEPASTSAAVTAPSALMIATTNIPLGRSAALVRRADRKAPDLVLVNPDAATAAEVASMLDFAFQRADKARDGDRLYLDAPTAKPRVNPANLPQVEAYLAAVRAASVTHVNGVGNVKAIPVEVKSLR